MPPPRIYQYHYVALEAARGIWQATETFITNPRNIDDRSLLTMDSEWVANLSRYIAEHDWQDRKRKPKD